MHKCGYIAIVGWPSSGKSTLINNIIKKRISITSAKPQTTRQCILGIHTSQMAQAIYIDTPGMHPTLTSHRAFDYYLQRAAKSALLSADVILWVWDSQKPWGEREKQLCQLLANDRPLPVVLAINKIDCFKDKRLLLPLMSTISSQFNFTQIVPISARFSENIPCLENYLTALLPEGPAIFPSDQITNKNIEFQLAEIIRKLIIDTTQQEIPYVTAVQIEKISQEKNIIKINALIQVERPGQKAIIIGQQGAYLKALGTKARYQMEQLLGKKVLLLLFVKVQAHWTNQDEQLRQLGYT